MNTGVLKQKISNGGDAFHPQMSQKDEQFYLVLERRISLLGFVCLPKYVLFANTKSTLIFQRFTFKFLFCA